MADKTSPQIDRFKEAARELGADRESGADDLLRRMATMKPEPRRKPRAKDDTEDDKPGH